MGDQTTDQVSRVPKQVSRPMWLGDKQTSNDRHQSSKPSREDD